MTLATTTSAAISRLSADLDIPHEVVDKVIKGFINHVMEALRHEHPFQIWRLGTLYFKYSRRRSSTDVPSIIIDKIRRSVHFLPSMHVKAELHGYVHDLGIKNNKPRELARLRLKPDQIFRLRQKKVLDEQRQLGFRAEMLFDNVSVQDKLVEKTLPEPPTVDQIVKRVWHNLGQ